MAQGSVRRIEGVRPKAPGEKTQRASVVASLATALAALCGWVFSSAVAVEAQPVGLEFQVNTSTYYTQTTPSVATDGNGGFVVVWSSFYGSNSDIYGQRYDSDGTALGSEFEVNTHLLDLQIEPKVGAGSNGDFVVVWLSYSQDGYAYGVFGQRYASNGTAQGTEFQVNTYTIDSQYDPSIAVAPSGDFLVTWSSASYQDGDYLGVFGQRFASNGTAVGIEFQVNTYTIGRQSRSAVAAGGNGDFVVVWRSPQDGASYGIFAQRFSSAGSALGVEFQVNTFTASSEDDPAVAVAANGDFVVTWTGYQQDGPNTGIFAQRYSSNGMAAGNEFQVNIHTTFPENDPAVAVASNGDFVVTWTSDGQDGDYYGIFGQRYASNGTPIAGEFQVNTYTASAQFEPTVSWSPAGSFVVAWDSRYQDGYDDGIFAQRFGVGAVPTGCPATQLSGCVSPGKSLLLVKDKNEDGAGPGDKLVWKWLKGPASMQSDFGNPTTTADYRFCIYTDTVTLALEANVPAGAPWAVISTKGYKYKDPTAAVHGIKQVLVKSGAAGKSKILVKGKDGALDLSASTLPFTSTDVTVQLSNTQNSNCWQTTFSVAAAKKNTDGQFKAKVP